ncbi:MAG: toxin-antitoxin system YwqK family antitoxin [Bacteroidales bacterium]
MKSSFYLIIITLSLLGLITTSCRSGQENGLQTEESMNQYDSAGKKHGSWKLYSDSALVAKGSYQHGKKEGLWTYYYPDGQMKAEGHFQKDIKNGMWIEWYPDGEIMWKGEWDHGIRTIEQKEANPRILVNGKIFNGEVLSRDSTYHVQIRIPNIPVSHLFVEVDKGEISQVEDSDHFLLQTTSDSMLTMAVGYIPDLEFRDFRNLAYEYHFRIK